MLGGTTGQKQEGPVGVVAGYSGTPLDRKLGLREGAAFFVDVEPSYAARVDLAALGLVSWAPARRLGGPIDLAVVFCGTRGRLARRFAAVAERLTPAGALWVCWPKQASGVATELDGTAVREHGLAAGLVDVKVAAVDDVWSGLKFVRRLRDR